MRRPRPAAMIIARENCAMSTLGVERAAPRARDRFVEPLLQRRELGMLEIVLEIAPHARQELGVARLAVTLPQPREDADDFGVALCRQQRSRELKADDVERGIARFAPGD